MGNNPILYNDPEGDCPWCAIFDYAWQVTANLIDGKSGYDAFIGDVDFVSVGVSLIPGGKGLMKAVKVIGAGVSLAYEYTPNEKGRVKSKNEIITGALTGVASKRIAKKIEKASSDKVYNKMKMQTQKQAKKVNNLEAKLKKKPQNTNINKKLDVAKSKLVTARKREVGAGMMNETFGKVSREVIEKGVDKSLEQSVKEAAPRSRF
ncbi:MAG: hypothetical protein PHQ74_05640 [Crocinitomicaceae bacterium]|nr:hypothetical protein [Crocinitomicaceae bacterium]